MQELKRLTDRIWIFTHESMRDRPCLGYVKGDGWSLAVDAGHSDDHVGAFYRALESAGLSLPNLTVLTHWHWDHTFGMHAVRGLTLANELTGRYLRSARERIGAEGTEWFFALDERICREYAGGRPVVVALPDLVFSGRMGLDVGGCAVELFQTEAPHTDDSTLVFVPSEKVLFIGDAKSGVFPTWEKDSVLCRKLAEAVARLDFDVCVGSHWKPMTKDQLLSGLLPGIEVA